MSKRRNSKRSETNPKQEGIIRFAVGFVFCGALGFVTGFFNSVYGSSSSWLIVSCALGSLLGILGGLAALKFAWAGKVLDFLLGDGRWW
jgi:hypothetical protein